MNIIFSVDVSSVMKWITEYTDYKLHFEENWLKRLDMEYRCQR